MSSRKNRVTSSLYKNNSFLQDQYWIVYLVTAIIAALAIAGLVKFPSWHWILPLFAAPTAGYANFRVRSVETHRDALIWLAVLFVAIVGGLALLGWSAAQR